MPLEPACVLFEGETPARVQRLGDGSCCSTPVEDFQWSHTDEDGVCTVHSRLELIERILSARRVAEVITLLEDVLSQLTSTWLDQQTFEAIEML